MLEAFRRGKRDGKIITTENRGSWGRHILEMKELRREESDLTLFVYEAGGLFGELFAALTLMNPGIPTDVEIEVDQNGNPIRKVK